MSMGAQEEAFRHLMESITKPGVTLLLYRHDNDCPAAGGDGTLCRCDPDLEIQRIEPEPKP